MGEWWDCLQKPIEDQRKMYPKLVSFAEVHWSSVWKASVSV